jgi:hypothetical protein
VADLATPDATTANDRRGLTLLPAALIGAAVAVLLGVYGRNHDAAGQALFTFGFSGTINMKAWLATIVFALAITQLLLALWMYGKLGRASAPPWVAPTHRLVGTLAFLVSLPSRTTASGRSASRPLRTAPACSGTRCSDARSTARSQ